MQCRLHNIAKLQEWKIRRCWPQEELRIMARCFLHHQAQGHCVTFKRFGEAYSTAEIESYLKQNPLVDGSDEELPGHLEAVPTTAAEEQQLESDDLGPDQLTLAASSQVSTSASSRNIPAEERPTKKRKAVSWSSLPHRDASSSRQPRQSERNDHAAEAEVTDDQDDGDKSAGDKKKEMEKAFATLRAVSQGLPSGDKKYADAVTQVEQLLKKAMEEEQPEQEETDLGPLHWAALSDDETTAKALIDKGADINARGGIGWTALHIAAFKSLEVLRLLLFQGNIDIDAVDNRGATALIRAVVEPSLECAVLLLQKGANPDVGSFRGKSVLHYACLRSGMDELVKAIAGKTSQIDRQDHNGATALHIAVAENKEDYVITLMEAGASLDIQDRDGRTPVHQAAFDGSPEMLLRMVDSNSDLTLKGNDDETVLHILCQRPDLCEVAEAVVKKPGVDINAKSRSGTTPLGGAAYHNCFDTVRMLVSHGADVEAADVEADTALNVAISKGNKEIANFLIENGSPLNPKNQSVKKWRAMLERNRRVQLALLPPRATKQPSTTKPRAQSSPAVVRNQSSKIGISPSEMQTLQTLVTKLMKQSGGPQSNHPTSPKFGATPSHSAPAPLFVVGSDPNTFGLNAQGSSGQGFMLDEFMFGGGANYSNMEWDLPAQDTGYFGRNLGL
ncbi:uncharacterized protein PV07_03004 [Cladophialophora immunda]|uniref:Uncharacterized protein n=1 Tax=Cladophialophora immunda TaxID=569365 RepID=A0A0D2B164_9EURO|nr:uncharacterized protein PV07_03004 [Cladophialophora immunda]KIW31347.1 hypothetical protein PV07_03004 [Cladophialophora immunda]